MKKYLFFALFFLFFYNANSQFSNNPISPFSTPNLFTRAIDYNNDGKDDVFVWQHKVLNSGKLFRNNGGTFTDVSNAANAPFYTWMSTADFDKNGYTDLWCTSGDTLIIAFNCGSVFSSPTIGCGKFLVSALFNVPASSIYSVPKFSDVDGDGIYDICIRVISGSSTNILMKKGIIGSASCPYAFASGSAVNLASIATTQEVDFQFADTDSDNDFDLLIANATNQYGPATYRHFLNNGSGVFSQITTSNFSNGRLSAFGTLGELNNDGNVDVISGAADCCVGANPLYAFFSNGPNLFSSNTNSIPRLLNPYYAGAEIHDINLDGRQDILWVAMSSIGSSALQVYLNNGSSTFTESASSLGVNYGPSNGFCCPIQNFQASTVLDINDDKKPDIDIHEIDDISPFTVTRSWQMINNSSNNSIKIKLNACTGLREGWGARVRYKSGGTWRFYQHVAYSSYNKYPFIFFGLGGSNVIDSLVVNWIGGQVSTLTNISAGSFITVNENSNCIYPSFGAGALSGSTQLCVNSTSQYSSTVAGGSWSSSNPSVLTISTTNGMASAIAAGTAYLYYTVTGNCGYARDSLLVTITSPPAPATISGQNQTCVGSTLQLTSNVPGGIWSTNNANLLSISGTGLVTGIGIGSATISYTLIGSGGCHNSVSSFSVTILQAPTINAGSDTTIIIGDRYTMQASGSGGSYLWSPSIGLSSTSTLNPVASPTTTTVYTLRVTNLIGCSASDNIIIKVISYCLKPMKAFTPNGDGINDFWVVTNGPCATKVKVQVFNRYGSKVFEHPDYKNNWDGTYNGRPLPDGTYYYIIHFSLINGNFETKTGNVTILR